MAQADPDCQSIKASFQAAWADFQTRDLPVHAQYDYIFRNQRLEFQFSGFLNVLLDAAYHIFAAQQIQAILKPQLCLLGNGRGWEHAYINSGFS